MSWPPPAGKRRETGRAYRRGTRMIRQRTLARGGNPGQPYAQVTDPDRIKHAERETHWCAECFGPRSRYRKGMFCFRCERELFGNGTSGYTSFIASERARMRFVYRRWADARDAPGRHRR